MNYRTMVKGALAFSLSLIVGTAWAADTQTYGVTFENQANPPINDNAYTNNMPITDATLHTGSGDAAYGWLAAAEDESKVIDQGGTNQVLQLNTDANTLTNKFESEIAGGLNTAIGGDGAFFETEVKFVASDTLDAGIQGGQDATKFAIYAYSNDTPPEGENSTTNLVVFHAVKDSNTGVISFTNEVFDIPIDCDVYTKLRIEMKKLTDPADPEDPEDDVQYNVFSVKVGETVLSSDTAFDAYLDGVQSGSWFLTVENQNGGNATKQVSSLNFKGTGEIDNIKVGTIQNYVPDSNWTIAGFNPAPAVWPLPVAVAADSKTLFYSNIVVNADDDTGGRPVVGAWVGISVIAPEAVTSENVGTWYFNVLGNGSALASELQFSAQNPELEDGHYVLHDWFGITPSNIRSAIAQQRSIVYAFEFYPESDPTAKQTLTIDISPKNIQLNANGVAGAEDLKVIDWAEQPKVSWTVENVSVTTNDAAAVAGFFAPNTVITFTPDQGMAITNIDGVAVNYAADAAFTLNVTQSTNITVKAGTVSSERVKPNWATAADDTKFWKWVDDNNVSDYASTDYTAQYLMNVAPNANPVLKIDSIVVTAEGSQIVVSAANGETAINLAAINGVLNVSVGSTVSELTSKDPDKNATFTDNKATVIIKTADGAFAKATVDFVAAETKLSQVE